MKSSDGLRQAQLYIMDEIKRICDLHNIKYFLDCGSMLGAVRHNGFIPWDDDLDVGMLKEEYEKFHTYAQTDLSTCFYIKNYIVDKEYGLPYSKLCLKDTRYVERRGNSKAKHLEVFVDIFPYIVRSENHLIGKFRSVKERILTQVFMAQSGFCTWKDTRGLKRCKFLIIQMIAIFQTKNFTYRLLKNIYDHEFCSSLVEIYDGIACSYWYYPKLFLNEYIDIAFEDRVYKIPKKYDQILRICYGDYMTMPPLDERETHEIELLDLGDYDFS